MSSRTSIFQKAWSSVFFWLLFIFILSSVPSRYIPFFSAPYFHKTVHFIEYAVLGMLGMRAAAGFWPGMKIQKLFLIALTLTTVLGISDEWHQTFVPGRRGKLEDVLVDILCGIGGIALYCLLKKRSGRTCSPKGNAGS